MPGDAAEFLCSGGFASSAVSARRALQVDGVAAAGEQARGCELQGHAVTSLRGASFH